MPAGAGMMLPAADKFFEGILYVFQENLAKYGGIRPVQMAFGRFSNKSNIPSGGIIMESSATPKKSAGLSNKVIIIAAAVIVIAVLVTGMLLMSGQDRGSSPAIGYATDAKVMLDQNTLQAAMDEALKNSREGNIALLYKNNAYSTDGKNFECYIVNSADNSYDMFITIFADGGLSDQLFLSELLPPGSGFEKVTLDRSLPPGDHTVYVALTQVDTDENGEQVIHKQVVHTMDFHVVE